VESGERVERVETPSRTFVNASYGCSVCV
jgi:hypothetical protein